MQYKLNLSLPFLLFLISVQTSFGQKQTPDVATFTVTPLIGFQGTHQQGIFGGLSITCHSLAAVTLTYGNDDLNSLSFSGNWYLNDSENQVYLKAGASRFWLIEQDSYKYRLTSGHTGIGFQSIFFGNFVLNSEILALKYIRQSYSTPDFKIKNRFNLDENYFFLLGLSLGYRFSF